jgi:hypothetical protein
MTSPFDALDTLASGAALEGFGEEAVLIPRRGSQYAESAADADRMAVKVRGIFSALAAPSDLRGQSRGGEFTGTTRMVSEQSAFWIAAAQVVSLGFRPAKGDLLRLPERCGSPSRAYPVNAYTYYMLGVANHPNRAR